jgi:hypothetical protein
LTAPAAHARIPVSFGELLDRISILEIKQERIVDPPRRAHVLVELEMLREVRREAGLDETRLDPLYRELKAVNLELWGIEDDIRGHEARKLFDASFVTLARAVYQTNDRRAALKQRINTATNSAIEEQKLYAAY